mmetsp:Transcript_33958/g.101360  ORF Transcript_33958/g.101360 Transcript_33958/m.101360 type:complete len:85 (-) Transcript_33958:176-430(-)
MHRGSQEIYMRKGICCKRGIAKRCVTCGFRFFNNTPNILVQVRMQMDTDRGDETRRYSLGFSHAAKDAARGKYWQDALNQQYLI